MQRDPETTAEADMLADLRARYEEAVRGLDTCVAGMRRDGASDETIACALHAERRRLAALFKERTPEPYRTRLYERTLRVYGNEFGPTIAMLRASGKSWEAIIAGAIRPGPRLRFDDDRG